MKKTALITVSIAVVLFSGCTGKVQTNPITEDTKYSLPSKTFYNDFTIEKEYLDDFDKFAKERLEKKEYHTTENEKSPKAYNQEELENSKNYNQSVWDLGYKKAKQ